MVFDDDEPCVLLAVTTNEKIPVEVGVPDTTPVAEPRATPGGRAPLVTV